jgi:hypothetical protein
MCALLTAGAPEYSENDVLISELVEVGASAKALDSSVTRLKKQYTEIQAQMKAGAKVTPEVIKTIETMENMITDEIEPAIKDAKESDQKLIDAKHQAIRDLNSITSQTIESLQSRASDIRTDIAAHNEAAAKWKGDAAAYGASIVSYEKTVTEKTTTCCKQQNAAVPDVEYTPAYAECDYPKQDSKHCVAEAEAAIDHAVQHAFEAGEAEYKSLTAQCASLTTEVSAARKDLDGKNEVCDAAAADTRAKASEINKELPEFYKAWNTAKSSYAEEYGDKTKDYADTMKVVKANEVDRNNEWDSTQEIKCMLSNYVAGGSFDKGLEGCKNSIDHSFLAINYPATPAPLAWILAPFATLTDTTPISDDCDKEESVDEDADKKCDITPANPLPACVDGDEDEEHPPMYLSQMSSTTSTSLPNTGR